MKGLESSGVQAMSWEKKKRDTGTKTNFKGFLHTHAKRSRPFTTLAKDSKDAGSLIGAGISRNHHLGS